ncbi:unnamed protein product [Mesocestoides corti]|uniref:Peptidase S9 prolyl oligopeptidase catalytic domain-containing protein n=1 Tax=Mesocestoides corti TaxID=53468 RepID=A0A158QSZ0_MESCO|nr:unnamed protein product [Mesocestoides corti]
MFERSDDAISGNRVEISSNKEPIRPQESPIIDNGEADFAEDQSIVDDMGMKSSSQVAKHNWKGLVLALLVITVISSLIVLACFLTYDYKFVYVSANGSLLAIDLKTHKTKVLLSSAQIREKEHFMGCSGVSDDTNALLLRYVHVPIYRKSHYSQYQAILLSNDQHPRVLQRIDIAPDLESADHTFLNHAELSPNSEALAFVYNDRIFCQKHPFNQSTANKPVDLTTSIYKENVRYGIAGFLYEEEIIGVSQTFWWSPGGRHLAFTAIDESNVTKGYTMSFGTQDAPGPRLMHHRYPLVRYRVLIFAEIANTTDEINAAETNPYNLPYLTIYIYSLTTDELHAYARPMGLPGNAHLTFFKWISDDEFLCGWVSRKWDKSWIVLGEVPTKSMRVIYHERARFGWINLPNQLLQMPIVEPDRQSILTVIPNYYSNQVYRGIVRLYLNISRSTTAQYPQWVHTPDYDVRDILYAFGGNEILYASSGPDSKEMHVFISRGITEATCLTCGDPNCTYNVAKVSKDGRTLFVECLGPSPLTYTLKVLVRNNTVANNGPAYYLKTISVVSNNTEFKEIVATKAMAVTKYRNVTLRKGTKQEVTLQAKFIQPPELIESHIIQYPVLFDTYGGPSTQLVSTKFRLDWQTYLVTRFKFVAISIDGRGTASRGKIFENAIYRNFGVVEVQDQMDGYRQILEDHKFLNKSAICTFGWSYGGFTVASILGHADNDFINCGVAVAPVSDFGLYDSAYTEKYLGLYSENAHEYKLFKQAISCFKQRTQVGRLARNFKNKDFLIIHGMTDDNVYLIHSALLITELLKHGVYFDMMFYPDDNHFLINSHVRPHLWRKLITFIVDSVNKTSIRHRHSFDEM